MIEQLEKNLTELEKGLEDFLALIREINADFEQLLGDDDEQERTV